MEMMQGVKEGFDKTLRWDVASWNNHLTHSFPPGLIYLRPNQRIREMFCMFFLFIAYLPTKKI